MEAEVVEVGEVVKGRTKGHSQHAHQTHLFSLSQSFPTLSPDHYADDLEDELDQAMLADFHAQLEDGSPREVRRFDLRFSTTTAARCERATKLSWNALSCFCP